MADVSSPRLPPQNLHAERSVLGSILLQNDAIDDIADKLKAEHFYSDIHQAIYAAIIRLHESGRRSDVVTLAEELDARMQLDDIGGPPYLMEILESVPHAAHAKYYAEIVRDKWIQRSLTNVCTVILKDCYEGTDDTADVLERAEQGIFQILENQETGAKLGMDDIMLATLDRINARIGKDGSISGLSTGFTELDRQTNGFQESELIILAARPSMGKTAFVCNIAEWVAGAGETAALIFSLEQSKLELAERFLCIRAKLDGHRLRKGLLDPAERHALLEASSELSR
ncbi:MAG: replicative DNA helicase, partial [Planctomycetes bacterium]|nr:replicative DNA helicase [Planctomycetota bacterium]